MPLIVAVLPPVLFFLLLILVRPPWPGIARSTGGYALLSLGMGLPLAVLCLPPILGLRGRIGACLIAVLGALALCAHAGLVAQMVRDLDVGALQWPTVRNGVGIALSTLALPLGLLLVDGLPKSGLLLFVVITVVAGAVTQLLWFGLVWIVEGLGGIHFWLATRTLIIVGVGAVAGIIVGSARQYKPTRLTPDWGGTTEILLARLPHPLGLSTLITVALACTVALRIAAERTTAERLVDQRMDEYYLALANLRRAQRAELDYTELYRELDLTRRALVGAAAFDDQVPSLLVPLLDQIENLTQDTTIDHQFRDATLALNRRLLALGEPFFLQPHVIHDQGWPLRFVLRYSVSNIRRYQLASGPSVPIVRLRRLDGVPVDTPYTGLSYDGIGTVLLDHIARMVAREELKLFAPRATQPQASHGRFATTKSLIATDRLQGLLGYLTSQQLDDRQVLASLVKASERADQVPFRLGLNLNQRIVFDALTAVFIEQTSIHEARHAFDGARDDQLPQLEELVAANVSRAAAAEIRAYLTEMIDGPLGARFALSTVGQLLTDEEAQANAYLFASIVILEGLWGERIRRPDVVEHLTDTGSTWRFAHISSAHPGWLSYSRILGAYADLRELSEGALKGRARELFESLFNEEYRPIRRLDTL